MKYTFETALAFMKQGKSICRECELWRYRILDGVVVYEDEHGFCNCDDVSFTSDEVLAEDLEVVE